MSDSSKLTLLKTREPVKQSRADLSSAKDILAIGCNNDRLFVVKY